MKRGIYAVVQPDVLRHPDHGHDFSSAVDVCGTCIICYYSERKKLNELAYMYNLSGVLHHAYYSVSESESESRRSSHGLSVSSSASLRLSTRV